MAKKISHRYATAEFRPYVTALGQLALAWNELHENLGSLFLTTMLPNRPQAGDAVFNSSLWVWHSVKSDRTQRDMLREAIERCPWRRDKLVTDGFWLLDRANSLSDQRNDAIHAPLFYAGKYLFGELTEGRGQVVPRFWSFNPRARKLWERANLLAEFRYCRDTAMVLADYTKEIESSQINLQRPWPDRPSLPIRPPKKIPPSQRRQAQPK